MDMALMLGALLEMRTNISWVEEEEEEGAWAGGARVVLVVVDCAVLLVTLVLGSAANVFVVLAVRRQRSLQTATNALLVNLALVDLMRCVTDCPLLLLVVVLRARGRADLGPGLCGAQLACFSLICGAQLLTVAGISLERHRAVVRPFEGGGGGERRKRVAAWIPLTWAAPALTSGLCARYARDSPVYARCRGVRAPELRTYDSFGQYVLLPAWCACLVVIAVCYAHMFLVVRAHGRRILDQGMFPPPGQKQGERTIEEKRTAVDTVSALETAEPQVLAELTRTGDPVTLTTPGSTGSQTPTTDSLTRVSELREDASEPTHPKECASPAPSDTQSWSVTHQSARSRGAHQSAHEPLDVEDNDTSPDEAQSAHENAHEPLDMEDNDTSPDEAESAQENAHEEPYQDAQQKEDRAALQDGQEISATAAQVSAPQEEEVVGAVCMMPSLANRDKANKKKESKLAKRSGYIIFTFLIFWLPLMGTIVFNIFLERKEGPGVEVIYELEVLAVCIAFMTSLTNPIIYAAVNPQFHNEFYYLKNKCKALCVKQ